MKIQSYAHRRVGGEGKGAKRLSDAVSIYMQIPVCGRIGARVLLFFCLYSAWQISSARYFRAAVCPGHVDAVYFTGQRSNSRFFFTLVRESLSPGARHLCTCARIAVVVVGDSITVVKRSVTETRTRLREKSLLIAKPCSTSDIANVKNTQKYYNYQDEKTKTGTRAQYLCTFRLRSSRYCACYLLFVSIPRKHTAAAAFAVNVSPRSPNMLVVQLNTCMLGAVSNSRIRRIRKPSCKNALKGGLSTPFEKCLNIYKYVVE